MFGSVVPASVVVSSATSAARGFDLYSSIGLGVGSGMVAVSLVFALAYLNIIEAIPEERDGARALKLTLVGLVVPLLVTFGGIVLFESASVIGLRP